MGGAFFWDEVHISKLIEIFPEGRICILVNGNIAGCALSLIVDYKKFSDSHTYTQITGYTFSTHNKKGDVFYGIDFFVHQELHTFGAVRNLKDRRLDIYKILNKSKK